MSARSERIKLETMYYHMRDDVHREFLRTRESYSWWRQINTFKGGPVPEVTVGTKTPQHVLSDSLNYGK